MIPPPACFASLLLIVASAGNGGAQTLWTVDGSGAGDFTDLQAAIDHAEPGDLLYVAPGSYASAKVNSQISLLADATLPRPSIETLEVLGAGGSELLHFAIGSLRLEGAGRVLLDDCRIGPGAPWKNTFASFLVTGGAELLLTQSEVQGGYVGVDGLPALLVEGQSSVQVVASSIQGADVPASTLYKLSGFGGPGLVIKDGARVWLAASDVRGGTGQDFDTGSGLESGEGGVGISLAGGGLLDLRGPPNAVIAGGLQNPGQSGFYDGSALLCSGFSSPQISLAEVEMIGGVSGCGSIEYINRGYLLPSGLAGVSDSRSVGCFGKVGQLALLATSFQPGLSQPLVLSGTPLFLDSNALTELVPMLLTGFDKPLIFTWEQPSGSAFLGLTYNVQLIELNTWHGMIGANSVALVLMPENPLAPGAGTGG